VTRRHLLLDTSVAVPLAFAGHAAHAATVQALAGMTLGLAGHAAFETFSVLTRLPPPARRSPAAVSRLISANFPESRFLSPQATGQLLRALPELGIAGGSVYDALIAACAAEHDLVLLTRDQRAAETYRAVDAVVQLLA
jgi:predicted nucleic acid-binding protein